MAPRASSSRGRGFNASALDRRLGQLRHHGPRFFSEGFGASALLEQLQGRAHGMGVPELGAVRLVKQPEPGPHETWRAQVESPASSGPLPEALRTLHFTLRQPAGHAAVKTPMVVVIELLPLLGSLPSRLLTARLAAAGIGSVLLEAPWHGARMAGAPAPGVTPTVEAFVLMQRTAALEACALAAWLLAQGHPRIALTGYGLGGALAAHAASVFPIPLAAVPLLAPDTAAAMFFEGVLAPVVDFTALEREAAGAENARTRLRRALEGIAVSGLEAGRPAALLAARRDGWVPQGATLRLARGLVGAPVRYLPGGHVEASLRSSGAALEMIRHALSALPEVDLSEP